MGEMSKILIMGGTGYFGKYLVEASVKLGHPTFVLLREDTARTLDKAKLLQSFKDSGVTFVYGDLYNKESLVSAIKKVDVVISALRHKTHQQWTEQMNIIAALKEAGNVKRYFPSEFGIDVERIDLLEPARSAIGIKAQIRQVIRDEGIPYTIVNSNYGAAYHLLSRIGQVEASDPPTNTITVLGDGNSRVVFVREEDTAVYTIKSADDPRALNKILFITPPANILSHNELISLWEEKSGKTFERVHLSEEDVLKKVQESSPPYDFGYALAHATFVKGELTNFQVDPSTGVEATELYPEVEYTTVDEFINRYI